MQKNRKKLLILFVIVCISIGFAYLSANLNIRGLIGYKASSWDVHFENVEIINNMTDSEIPVINNDTELDFNVLFSEPGEKYEFSVDVVNAGTINAMLSEFATSGIVESNKDYLNYTVKYEDGSSLKKNDAIRSSSRVRIVILVEYKYDSDRLATDELNLSFSAKYVRATDEANYLDQAFNSTDTSTTLFVNGAKANSISKLRIYGNSVQKSYEGKNLYNYKDVNYSDPTVIGSGSSADEDGWITIALDNTDGSISSNVAYSNYFTRNLNVEVGKTYSIILEVKEVSGTGSLNLFSSLSGNGQFGEGSYGFSNVEAGGVYIKTAQARESNNWGLRTFGAFAAGAGGSITFRISVYEGTDVTVDNFKYEPYVGGYSSPNIDYPQDIGSVSGTYKLEFTENLFEKEKAHIGYEILSGNDSYVKRDGWYASEFIKVEPNTKYAIFGKEGGTANCFYDENKKFISTSSLKNGVIMSPSNAVYLRVNDVINTIDSLVVTRVGKENLFIKDNATVGVELTGTGGTVGKNDAWFLSDYISVVPNETILQFGKSAGNYVIFYDSEKNYLSGGSYSNNPIPIPDGVAYIRVNGDIGSLDTYFMGKAESKIYNINLGDIQLNGIDNYRDYIYNRDNNWYVHREIVNTTLEDGTYIAGIQQNGGSSGQSYVGAFLLQNKIHIPNIKNVKMLSNKFVYKFDSSLINNVHANEMSDNTFALRQEDADRIYFRNTKYTELAGSEFKEKILPLELYYVQNKTIEEEITNQELINQLNQILDNNLYEGSNKITFSGNIKSDINIEYDSIN